MLKLPRPTTSDYDSKMKTEISLYEKIFDNNLTQAVPPVWNEVEKCFADTLESAIGVRNLYQYVERHVLSTRQKNIKILGLGSGACGNELDGIIPLLQKHSISVDLYCVDINQHALDLALSEANKRGVRFTPIISDINTISFESNSYDIIVAYASLHHFIELGRLAQQISKALTKNGVFVTVDIPTKNGYLMWPETYNIVCDLWGVIPPQFKIDHTGFSHPKYVEKYPNIDYSTNSFECINSEAILPALKKHLNCLSYVPAMSLTRRFFDTKFGPNYDLRNPLDKSTFAFITQLDCYYVSKNILKPETFFGAYQKK